MDEKKGNGFNVVDFYPPETTVDLNPDKILFNNIGEYDSFVLAGYDKDGDVRVCFTMAQIDEAISLLEKAKYLILKGTLD